MDFLHWQRGESSDPLSANDLATWRMNFGSGGQMAPIIVPEAPGLVMFISAITCVFALTFEEASRLRWLSRIRQRSRRSSSEALCHPSSGSRSSGAA